MAVDLATGRQSWTASDIFPWAPGGDRIYASAVWSDNQGIVALDATSGRQVWRQRAFLTAMVSPPLIYGSGSVYAGVELNGRTTALVAWDAVTGHQRWSVPSPDKTILGVTVANGMVYAGRARGEALAVHAASGAQLWKAPVGRVLGNQLAVTNGVLAGGGYGLAVTGSQGAWGLDAASGRLLWKNNSPTVNVVAAYGLVFISGAHSVMALDAASGQPAWQHKLPLTPPGFALLTVAGGVIYVGAHGAVYALAAGTGKLLWQTQADKTATQISVAGNTLLVATAEGMDGPGALHAWRL